MKLFRIENKKKLNIIINKLNISLRQKNISKTNLIKIKEIISYSNQLLSIIDSNDKKITEKLEKITLKFIKEFEDSNYI